MGCVARKLDCSGGLRLAMALAVGLWMPVICSAQPAVSAPAFAVSAIRASGPASGSGMSIKFLPGGRLVARNATLRVLIKIGYDLNDDQLDGGPTWIAFKRFDIDAKPDAGPGGDSKPMSDTETKAFNHALMQGLLKDRFDLKLRSEMKDMPIYALVVGKSGPRLTKSQGGSSGSPIKGRSGTIVGAGAAMDDLARELEENVHRPVPNLTGLDGRYDFKLEWTPDSAVAPAASPATDASDLGPNLFTAVQQQLGLKLEARKKSAPYKVVESVQLPSEN
ncbi:MAG TPA: TIGR03435 family protein [Acidobacteriaceae bacterium]